MQLTQYLVGVIIVAAMRLFVGAAEPQYNANALIPGSFYESGFADDPTDANADLL